MRVPPNYHVWSAGKAGHCVVSDRPIADGVPGSDAADFYGGHLVAESVPPSLVPLIVAAPKLLDWIKTLENDNGVIPEWLWNQRNELIAEAEGVIR